MDTAKNVNFWKPKSIVELAMEQGIDCAQSLDELTGAAADLWEDNKDFDRFLDSIDRHRREVTSV